MSITNNNGAVGATGLVYDGVDLTQTFQLVSIDIPPLPTISATTQDLAQRPGAYFVKRKIGTRTIKAVLRYDANSRDPMDIYKEGRNVTDLLAKDEPKQLQFNETNYCNAILVGTTTLKDEAYYGDIQLTFVCYDPYIYGDERTVSLSNNTAEQIAVAGREPTYPILTLTATGSSVTVTNVTTGQYVAIPGTSNGASIVVDMEKQLTTIANVYAPVDLLSDYFPISGTVSVKVQGASGTLKYRERYL